MVPLWSWLNSVEAAGLLAQQTVPQATELELMRVFADLLTFAAYAVIPLLILFSILRRRHVHFSRVWFLLVMYLIVGSAAHVLDAIDWDLAQRMAIVMKVVLAFIACVWVIVLIPLLPMLLELRTAEEFTQLLNKHEEAEQALREREALYKSLIDSLPLNVFRKDLAGRFVDGNQRFCDTLGKPLAKIVGKSDLDFF